MTGMDLQSLDIDSFKDYCKSLSISEIENNINNLNPEQLVCLIKTLGEEEGDSKHENKLLAILSALEDRSSLEIVGKVISARQFFQTLHSKRKIEHFNIHKIPPLLVGMPFDVFTEVLLEIPNELLTTLQEEGCTEPLQHQLTLFCHELVKELDILSENLINLESHIDTFDTKNISHENMLDTHQDIEKWQNYANNNLIRIKNALAVAWNTSRPDIIDTLSFQKESWLKYNTLVIGQQRQYDQPATGLYARFESRLNTVFSNPDDPNDIEALKDDEPAVEALVKFSLWYLHDYWEIGLLPDVDNISGLDLDPAKHTERERADHRAALFAEAQANLEKLGLSTVSDLKNKEIYSKAMLQEYLQSTL